MHIFNHHCMYLTVQLCYLISLFYFLLMPSVTVMKDKLLLYMLLICLVPLNTQYLSAVVNILQK